MKLTITYESADVASVRPDLTYEQCCDVLRFTEREFTKQTGVSLPVLEAIADFLFPSK